MADKGTDLALINELSDTPITKELVASEDFSKKYALLVYYLESLNNLKTMVDGNIKEIIKEEYLETGESTVVSAGYKYTFIPEGTRESLNTRALKADHPDLYKEYVKVSPVSASLRVTKVEKKDA